MRILYIVSQFPKLTETFVAREMEQLVKMGHEVLIFPLRPDLKPVSHSGMEVQGAKVIRCSFNPLALLSAQIWLLSRRPDIWISGWKDVFDDLEKLPRLHHLSYILIATTWLARELQGIKIDHIRGHFLHSEAISSKWLSGMIKAPYSLTAHTTILHYPQEFIRQVLQGAAFLIGISKDVCDFVRKISSRNIFLIYNSIDLDAFPMLKPDSTTGPVPLVLAVGSLIEKKGFDVLIEAAHLLEQQGVSFNCRIIGEGHERPRLEKMVKDFGLEGMVSLPGAMPFQKVKEEFMQATITAMPSRNLPGDRDGLPTVLIESMALGIPVVSTRMAGIPDLVRDGETGLLAEPDDPKSLAAALLKLMQSSDLRERFSSAGRRLIEKKFDIQKSALKLSNLIEQNLGAGF